MIQFPEIQSRIQFITKINEIELYMLREDEIHPTISGNKFRKLKYNLIEFQKGNYDSILTFGGAYSNHISSVAAAGKEFSFKTIGIIRGEEIADKINENPTLTFAQNCGMEFKFISRELYRNKSNPDFLNELKSEFGNIYILPEGGTNELAVKGCEEILGNHTQDFDFVCCAIGTGGTIFGIINSSEKHQQILGFPALKDSEFLKNEINKFTSRSNWRLISDFHFGGYAKVNDELLDFINDFKSRFDVTLEPIYTGKMIFGIIKLMNENHFPKKTKVLAVHTGGLQGIEGMNQKLIKNKKNNYKMIKNLGLLTFLLLFSIKNFAQESRDLEYIRKHAKLAVEEMEFYKIPASITLSQGILETGGGQSRLAEIAFNHFGIKCKSKQEWSGDVISHTDDAPNECFRKYNSVQESYRDHSKFLAERPYYKDLFKLDMHDYKAWAHGLKKAGYATNPKYAGILISRIEKYNLHEFDKISSLEVYSKLEELYGAFDNTVVLSNVPSPVYKSAGAPIKVVEEVITSVMPEPVNKTIEVAKREENPMMRIKKHANGVQYIIANEGETFSKLANLYEINSKKLASYNELPENGKLTPGQLVFFDKKKTKGKEKFYKVQQGDNMYLISQKVGMKVDKLYSLNKMKAGQQPKAGTVLNLKTKKK